MCCSVMFGTLGRCPVFEINSIFIISLCIPLYFFQCILTLKMETKTKFIEEDFTSHSTGTSYAERRPAAPLTWTVSKAKLKYFNFYVSREMHSSKRNCHMIAQTDSSVAACQPANVMSAK